MIQIRLQHVTEYTHVIISAHVIVFTHVIISTHVILSIHVTVSTYVTVSTHVIVSTHVLVSTHVIVSTYVTASTYLIVSTHVTLSTHVIVFTHVTVSTHVSSISVRFKSYFGGVKEESRHCACVTGSDVIRPEMTGSDVSQVTGSMSCTCPEVRVFLRFFLTIVVVQNVPLRMTGNSMTPGCDVTRSDGKSRDQKNPNYL